MGAIHFKLSEVMGRHRIKQRQLAEVAKVRPAAINALYHGDRERVDMGHLAAILDGLNTLTGQRYTVGDLLEYTPTDAPAPSPAEVQAASGLLIPPGKRGKARRLPSPVPVEGPPIEELLNSGAGELSAQLREMEADTPPAELDAWGAAFTGKPA